MFLMDTAIFVIDIRNTIKEISLTLTSNWDVSLQERYALTDTLPWQIAAALYAFMVRSTLLHSLPLNIDVYPA